MKAFSFVCFLLYAGGSFCNRLPYQSDSSGCSGQEIRKLSSNWKIPIDKPVGWHVTTFAVGCLANENENLNISVETPSFLIPGKKDGAEYFQLEPSSTESDSLEKHFIVILSKPLAGDFQVDDGLTVAIKVKFEKVSLVFSKEVDINVEPPINENFKLEDLTSTTVPPSVYPTRSTEELINEASTKDPEKAEITGKNAEVEHHERDENMILDYEGKKSSEPELEYYEMDENMIPDFEDIMSSEPGFWFLEAEEIKTKRLDYEERKSREPEIIKAACYGNRSTELVRELLDAGANIEERSLSEPDYDPYNYDDEIVNKTSLICATAEENKELINLLLQYGADVNAMDSEGVTSLMMAAGYLLPRHEEEGDFDNTDIVRILAEHGADINIKDKSGKDSLMNAAKWGTTDTVRVLLEHGADVNSKDENGRTSLIGASRAGKTDTVRILLKHGADINTQDTRGMTSLMYAAMWDKTDTVRILSDHGADLNAKDNNGMTSLMQFGNIDIVRILLEHGADINTKDKSGETSLMKAAGFFCHYEIPQFKKVPVLKILLEHGADVNAKDESGETSLMKSLGSSYRINRSFNESSCRSHDFFENIDEVATVKILLEHGADLHTKDVTGKTNLMYAAKWGFTDSVRILLEHGADINAKDDMGVTSLMLAAELGKTDTVRILLKHGAEINTQDTSGQTSLMKALGTRRLIFEPADFEKVATVKILLEHGADINTKDKYGQNSLMYAAQFGNTDTTRILLEHGADVNIKDTIGQTSLMYAAKWNTYTDTVGILLEHGAEVNAQNGWGGTSLMWAVESGNTDTVRILLEHGADINTRNEHGRTALDIAVYQQETAFNKKTEVSYSGREPILNVVYQYNLERRTEVTKLLRANGAKRGNDIE